jgi:hypothetical protein
MKTWYETKFPARFDPGPDVTAWPPDFQQAVTGATIRLCNRHPWLTHGRVIDCNAWVTRDSGILDFPYLIHIHLCWSHPAIQ